MCGSVSLQRESPNCSGWSSDIAYNLLLDSFNQAKLFSWPKECRNFHSPEGAVLPWAQDALSTCSPPQKPSFNSCFCSRLTHRHFWGILVLACCFQLQHAASATASSSSLPFIFDIINEMKHVLFIHHLHISLYPTLRIFCVFSALDNFYTLSKKICFLGRVSYPFVEGVVLLQPWYEAWVTQTYSWSSGNMNSGPTQQSTW